MKLLSKILFAIILTTTIGCSNNGRITIQGQLPSGTWQQAEEATLSVFYTKVPTPIASVAIEDDGAFKFEVASETPLYAQISLASKSDPLVTFIIEQESIVFNGNLQVENPSEANEELVDLLQKYKEAESADELYNLMDSVITRNPKSIPAAFILFRRCYNVLPISKTETLSQKFSQEVKNHIYLTNLNTLIEGYHFTEIGQKYVDFSSVTSSGDSLILSSLVGEGKWVLIDFWASWCPYCREENPNLVSAYNLYHDKGLEILGVSLDKSKEDWLKAVEDDSLTWHHVSDLDYWDCQPAKQYGVFGIPSNVIINPEGKIVARSLRGEDLIDFLKNNL